MILSKLFGAHYVSVAEQDFPPVGRKQSLTNIAFVTGIHRHEVKKLMVSAEQDDVVSPQHHRAARVISGWLTELDLSENGVAKLTARPTGVGLYYFQEKIDKN